MTPAALGTEPNRLALDLRTQRRPRLSPIRSALARIIKCLARDRKISADGSLYADRPRQRPHGLNGLRMADSAIVEGNLAQEMPTPAGAFEPGLYQPPTHSQAHRRLVHRLARAL